MHHKLINGAIDLKWYQVVIKRVIGIAVIDGIILIHCYLINRLIVSVGNKGVGGIISFFLVVITINDEFIQRI